MRHKKKKKKVNKIDIKTQQLRAQGAALALRVHGLDYGPLETSKPNGLQRLLKLLQRSKIKKEGSANHEE